MPRIAEIDRAILSHLRKNGRMSYVDLAREVNASERTVRTHVRKMEEEGTIRGYTIRRRRWFDCISKNQGTAWSRNRFICQRDYYMGLN